MKIRIETNIKLLLALSIIKFLLPYLVQCAYYEPHRDEFLYLAEGRHVDWGFLEVPPLISVFGWLIHLFGDGMFWIRFWPDLFDVLTFVLVGKIIISFGGKTFAVTLSALPFLIGNFAFFPFQPNFLEVFFWTLMAFSLIRYIQKSDSRWLYILGIAIGLGVNSKYSAAFFTLSIIIGLLATKEIKIFLNKHFYCALFLSFLIFLPNLIWEYTHRFPVFHQLNELKQKQLQYIRPVDFLSAQLLNDLTCMMIWVAGLSFILLSKPGRRFTVFGIAYVVLIIILVLLHGKEYYTFGIYPVLYAFGAYYLEVLTERRFRIVRYLLIIYAVFLGLYFFPETMPIAQPEVLARYYEATGINKTSSFKWEDHKYHQLPQDYADMLGWKETAEKVAAVYKNLPEDERSKTFIYCFGYGFAGAMMYYQQSFGLPPVYSSSSSFLLWLPYHYDIENVILVGRDLPSNNNIKFQQFEQVVVMDSLVCPFARENGVKVILFRHAKTKFNELMSKYAKEKQAVFTR